MAEFTIEKLVFGGMGLARTDKGVVFVKGALPQERVEAYIDGKLGGTPTAQVTRILTPSNVRRNPPCEYADRCGGCDWLYINYKNQLIYKKEAMLDCMKRIGKIENFPEINMFSSHEFGYRIRAQIKVENRITGFYKRHSNDIVQIKKCPLLSDPINDLLAKFNRNPDLIPSDVKSIKLISNENSIASSPVISGITKERIEIAVGKRVFTVSGESFFQGNGLLLEELGSWASLFSVNGEFCVDLYGGTGFFAVMIAKYFTKGLLIEGLGSQVEEAKKNFALNGITNFEAIESPAENLLKIPALNRKIDLFIIDPPRAGLTDPVREAIGKLGPRKLFYISCNPSTQARDLNYFINKQGYTIRAAALFDLYPNTHHLESVVLLYK